MTDELFLMLGISVGVFGLGALALLPIWVRNIKVMRGAVLPITEADIRMQRIARMLLLFGTMGAFVTALSLARNTLSFAGFMTVCGIVTAIVLAIAFRVDAVRARRHR